MKTGCLVSTLLGMVGVAMLLIVTVLLPSGALEQFTPVNQLLESILCTSGETLQVQPSSFTVPGEGTTFTTSTACISQNGSRRSVTDSVTLLGILGFVIPLLLALTVFSVMVRATAVHHKGLTLAGSTTLPRITTSPQMPTMLHGTLADRLAALEDAYHKHQITKEEYDSLRKTVLDQFSQG